MAIPHDADLGPAGIAVDVPDPVMLANTSGVYDAFPGLTRCANGDLLAAWRRASSHSAGGAVIMRRSTDNGVTWQSETRPLDSYATTYGTATLSTLPDGRVCLAGWLRASPEVTRIHFSTDHGVTFGPHVTVEHGFTARAVIEGPVIQAPDGNLLVAVWGRNEDEPANRCSVKVLRSTDDGATFTNPVTVAAGVTARRWWNEAGLYVLPSGEVHLVIREETMPVQLWVAKSRDAGITWTAPGGMHGWPNGVWSGAPKTSRLESLNVSAWIGRDTAAAKGASLIVTRGVHYRAAMIDPGTMMYGQCVDLGSGRVGVVVCIETSINSSDVRFYPLEVTLTE